MVPGIVQPVPLESEGSQPLSVIITSLPAIDPTEHTFTWQHRLEVLLDPRPGPVGNSGFHGTLYRAQRLIATQ
jgi:hypothetical protein